jgi:hypothetical protein
MDPDISTALARRGFSAERQAEGWALLHGAGQRAQPDPRPSKAKEAMARCEAFQAADLVCVRALVEIGHPEQAGFLFDGLELSHPAAAVYNVGVFLTRLHALHDAAARKETRAADHQALAVVEQTGVTRKLRKELEQAVAEVQQTTTARPDEEVARATAAEAERLDALRRIHVWLGSWSDVARTVLTRRDHLIRLGLAARRTSAKGQPPAPPPLAPQRGAPTPAEELAPPSRAA